MEMLRSLRGDKHEFCLTVINFKHVRSCPSLEQISLYDIFSHRVDKKTKSDYVQQKSCTMNYYYNELLPSGRRSWCLKVKPRTQKSFIPCSIRL